LSPTASFPRNLTDVFINEEDLDAGVQQLELPADAIQHFQQINQEVIGGALREGFSSIALRLERIAR
jgi:hypothetical protein